LPRRFVPRFFCDADFFLGFSGTWPPACQQASLHVTDFRIGRVKPLRSRIGEHLGDERLKLVGRKEARPLDLSPSLAPEDQTFKIRRCGDHSREVASGRPDGK
jgi:hypothetical protein